MLQLKLKQSNDIDRTGTLAYLVDDTDFYDPLLNTTGYGTPNVAREEVAVFPIGRLIDSKGGELPLKFKTFNPLSDTEWTAKVPKDGHLRFNLVYAPIVTEPDVLEYELGDVVFSSTDFMLVQKQLVEEEEVFVKVEPEVLLNSEVSSKSLDQFYIAQASLLLIDLQKRIVEKYIDSENLSNTKIIQRYQEQYDKTRGIIQAALYQFCIGNKAVAARYLEFLQTNSYELQ